MQQRGAYTGLVWLRDDLRLSDNPALHAAVQEGGAVAALFIHERRPDLRPIGAAAAFWLGESLAALARDLAALGIPLHICEGDPEILLPAIVAQTDAKSVFWNRRYGPAERALDARIKADLHARGMRARSFPGNVLVEPFDIATRTGTPYAVYTPFANALRARDIPAPLPAPQPVGPALPPPAPSRPCVAWQARIARHWRVGEAAAQERLYAFLDDIVEDYAEGRDRPAIEATSRLSPHLRFGEISARQVWAAARHRAGDRDKFLSELIWRDFNHHQLFHRPDIAHLPMRAVLDEGRWRSDPEGLSRWQRGLTGFPIIDAGMRQLWETGWMHNRVRMLAASLLSKNLLIDWRLGETWFWDTLVDADPASNPGNWQWVAGCGMDAAPYFRMFNPVTQGEKFDPRGAYVRRWVPELAGLPDAVIHKPFAASGALLAQTGYPYPIVDLAASRRRALGG